MAGQILATLLQTTWPWKAHTYLNGPRNSGKTSFFHTLKRAYWVPWRMCVGPGTSEAALRQAVGCRMPYLLVDEFEDNPARESILALFRMANQGGEVMKGSPSGQIHAYPFSQLVWVGSIDFAPENAADTSRFLAFDLQPITTKHKQRGLPPSLCSWSTYNHIFFTLVFRFHAKFWKTAAHLRTLSETGLDGRMQDALAVPCAIWATLDRKDPERLFRKVAERWTPELQLKVVDDEKALLRDILQCTIIGHPSDGGPTMRHAERRQIADCLQYGHHLMALESYGIKVTRKKYGGGVVALAPEAVKRHLLKGTKWAHLNIRSFLLRLPGATATRLRLLGMANARVITLPINVVLDLEA